MRLHEASKGLAPSLGFSDTYKSRIPFQGVDHIVCVDVGGVRTEERMRGCLGMSNAIDCRVRHDISVEAGSEKTAYGFITSVDELRDLGCQSALRVPLAWTHLTPDPRMKGG